jgi:hypothetical protein
VGGHTQRRRTRMVMRFRFLRKTKAWPAATLLVEMGSVITRPDAIRRWCSACSATRTYVVSRGGIC